VNTISLFIKAKMRKLCLGKISVSKIKISFYSLLLTGLILSGLISSAVFFVRSVGAQTQTPAWRSPEEERQIRAYRDTNESVVFITTISLAVDPNEMFFSLKPREGTGSGCVIDAARGIILTNLHVIQDAQRIEVTFANGQTSPAQQLGQDAETDLAVIKILKPPLGLQELKLGDSSQLEVGQRVLAIGNPFGLNRTLTTGIISSVDRTVRVNDQHTMRGLIQTDAAINPGNSGGALLDLEGRLIGVNSAILSSSGDSAGIGFAVPINQIRRVLPDLIERGKVLRPRAGWALVDTKFGVFVERIVPEGPADKAGLQPVLRRVEQAFLTAFVRDFSRADMLVKVDGRSVRTRDEVEDALSNVEPGQTIKLTVRRGSPNGTAREVALTPVLR